jgi:hypothetical protein
VGSVIPVPVLPVALDEAYVLGLRGAAQAAANDAKA